MRVTEQKLYFIHIQITKRFGISIISKKPDLFQIAFKFQQYILTEQTSVLCKSSNTLQNTMSYLKLFL